MPTITSAQLTSAQLELCSKTIAMLSADGVEKANSGHPGMPMGMADCAAVLWLKYLRFNPQDPRWLNRDRFIVSNGHGSMLLYSLLHLCGYDLTMNDLMSFRQWGSKTPGHPESHMTPGVECTTGPLGQGISNAVGMAIAQRVMAERYNTSDQAVCDHRIFVFAGDGCLMEGVSSEASSVAGHLGLGNITVIYDDNHISIAGHTELAFTEDVLKRYEAYGWHTLRVDGHDYAQIDSAIKESLSVTDRPTIIAARTYIGKGSPNKVDTHDVHGSPLGKDELALTKKGLGWPTDQMFYVPEDAKSVFAARVEELKKEYSQWQEKFGAWQKKNPDKAEKLKAQLNLTVGANLQDKLIEAVKDSVAKPISTRKLSGAVLQKASAEVSALIGGSADLEPSTLTLIKNSSDIQKNSFGGLNIRFGVREHGMGSIMNGFSYYGGFIPYGSTFLCFSDYMRPTLRLAALSHLPGLFIYTHESVFLGEDGPTHQPIEHLTSLRAMPNLWVMRPADAYETAVCYAIALERRDGPCAFAFTRQDLAPIERDQNFSPNMIRKGAYTVYESKPGSAPQLVFVATGSEVSLAIASAKVLAADTSVRVVSMPCWELYAQQSKAEQEALIPSASNKVVVEAATTYGWLGMINAAPEKTLLIGIDHYGASAPAKVLAEKFGLTVESIVPKVKQRFGI